MTVLTNIGGLNVSGIFSRGGCAVVTAKAIGNDRTVIEVGRCPGYGSVAIVALIGGGNVVDGFTRGRLTIVAAATAPNHQGMIHT